MKKIITGIDSRKRCGAALRATLKLAEKLNTRMDVVHAVDVPRPFWAGIDSLKLATLNASSMAEAWNRELEFLRRELPPVEGRSMESMLHVHPGSPAQVLCQHATEAGAEMLVLGDHEHRDILDFGSTLRACLSKSPFPIWFQRDEWQEIRTILVAVDMSQESASALQLAVRLARAFGASVEAVHCFAVPSTVISGGYYPEIAVPFPTEEIRESTQEEFNHFVSEHVPQDVKVTRTFRDGNARDGILEASDDCDLIVMGTHGRTGLARAVLGSVAYSVLQKAKKPVLAVPLARREWILE